MPGNSPLITGSCVLILALLVVRAAVRLGRERVFGSDCHSGPRPRGADRAHRADRAHSGEATHLAMAAGMALMLLPLPAVRRPLAVLFGALVLFEATVWAAEQFRRSQARELPPPPEHILELHHVVVGTAMAIMALRSVPAAGSMPGMMMAAGAPSLISLILFAYVWLSVLVLGGGLARTFRAGPGPQGLTAVLGAPSTVYACELAMTVIMGLMLLA